MEKSLQIIKPEKGGVYALDPCPFCGSSEIVYEQYEHHPGAVRWRVMCCGCCAMVDPGWAVHKISVRDRWNRRA